MTTLTKERLAEIRVAAEKATPGPWVVHRYARTSSYRMLLADRGKTMHAECIPADTADHIANCDPQTILALLDAAEAREVAVKPLEWDDEGDWDGDECAADTVAGHYMILASAQVEGKVRLVFNYQADGSIYQTQLIDGVSPPEARAFAEVHYENAIRSALQEPTK